MEFYTWDEMEKEVLSDTIARKIISGEKAMVAQVFLARGAIVPEHHHESEQITYILEGALQFEIGGQTIVVGKGTGEFYRRALSAPQTLNPAGTRSVPPKVEEVDVKWSVTEGGRTIEAYSLDTPHAAGYIIP